MSGSGALLIVMLALAGTDGTLIIDAYDRQDRKLVWCGSGTVAMKAKPHKRITQIDNILDRLGKRWDRILAGKGH